MVGTAQQVSEKMEAFQRDFMCTDLVCYMQVPGMDVAKGTKSMEQFARHVMPAFRA